MCRCWLIEPTESEPKHELDRFIDALISIRKEIDEVVEGKFSKEDNVFKNAPHPLQILTDDKWEKPYSREKAVFPVPGLKKSKFWPSVSRVDDGESGATRRETRRSGPNDNPMSMLTSVLAAGDLNLICECGSTEDYV